MVTLAPEGIMQEVGKKAQSVENVINYAANECSVAIIVNILQQFTKKWSHLLTTSLIFKVTLHNPCFMPMIEFRLLFN